MNNEPAFVNKYRWHGGPADRGSADAYYGRAKAPHKYPDGTGNGSKVQLTDPLEVAAYNWAFENETDRKDWG
jgi:hypothetical protein